MSHHVTIPVFYITAATGAKLKADCANADRSLPVRIHLQIQPPASEIACPGRRASPFVLLFVYVIDKNAKHLDAFVPRIVRVVFMHGEWGAVLREMSLMFAQLVFFM
jgi:hypothetical protein